jgi:8-oxo-dGTP pyrophosphatase MutT (NUDIX family)
MKHPSGRTLRPKDAATLVLVDFTGGAPRILMGRRRATQDFLPNKFVFPGGRVDRADSAIPALEELAPAQLQRLLFDMKGNPSPARARALGLAAIRETFEETGLLVAAPPSHPRPGNRGENRPHRTSHQAWQRFLAGGHVPQLSKLTFFARAITPPARPRRYDTRFFMADATHIAEHTAEPDEELGEIGWFTLDEVRALDLPNITRAVVEDLAQQLAARDTAVSVPYYRFERGTFRRDLIT